MKNKLMFNMMTMGVQTICVDEDMMNEMTNGDMLHNLFNDNLTIYSTNDYMELSVDEQDRANALLITTDGLTGFIVIDDTAQGSSYLIDVIEKL